MSTSFDLPNSAVPYILLQRMDTQKFRELRYQLPYGRTLYNTFYNKFLYRLEARLRRNEIKEQYLDELQNDFRTIKDHLPEDTTSVLDVGCGVGGINLFLSEHYKDQQPIFYLFDKTEISDVVYYQFRDTPAFYNSLDVAAETLQRNGVNEKNIHTLDADEFDLDELKNVDLCISLISWAFHYPLETYLEDVLESLSGDGVLLLDFRRNTNQLAKARRFFEDDDVIKSTEKYERVLLRGPRSSRERKVDNERRTRMVSTEDIG